MATRGRKPKPEPEQRRHGITCRLTDAELEHFMLGKPTSMSPGEWLRTRALKRQLPRPIPQANIEQWRELARALANLNQLARGANEGRYLSVDSMLLNGLTQEVRGLRRDLRGGDVIDESED